MNIYEEELHQIIHGNKMREYEEINMPFIATKLIEINKKVGKKAVTDHQERLHC